MHGPEEIRVEELQLETYTNLDEINAWQNTEFSLDKLLQLFVEKKNY